MIDTQIRKIELSYLFIFLWLAIAIVYTVVAALFMMHQKGSIEANDVFVMSFYHFVPVLTWSLLLPVIYRLRLKYSLVGNGWGRHLSIHALISILSAPAIRFFSIWLDFSIKGWLGMFEIPAIDEMSNVMLVVVASSPKAILYYWIVLLGTHWYYESLSQTKAKEIKEHLMVSTEQSKSQVKLKDIVWIKSSGNYVQIHTSNDTYSLRQTLTSVLKQLDHRFVRIHRSFIVNTDHIKKMQHWRRGEYLVIMDNDRSLSSSRSYKFNIDMILAS